MSRYCGCGCESDFDQMVARRLDAVENKNLEQQNEIDELSALGDVTIPPRLDNLESEVAVLSNKVDNNTERIVREENTNITQGTDIANLKNQYEGQNITVNGLSARMTVVEGDNTSQQLAINGLRSQTDDQEIRIQSNAQRISVMEAVDDAQTNRITTIEGVNANQQTALTGYGNRLNAIETLDSQQNTRLQGLETLVGDGHVVRDITVIPSASTTNLRTQYNAAQTVDKPLPVASSSEAGVMDTTLYNLVQTMNADINELMSAPRLLVDSGNLLTEDMSSAQVEARFIANYPNGTKSNGMQFLNVSNTIGFLWIEQAQVWRISGIPFDVPPAEQNSYGTIKGDETLTPGNIFMQSGTGQVIGWDNHESRISDVENDKLNKALGNNEVYAVVGDAQTQVPFAQSTDAGSLVQRTGTGTVKASNPAAADDVVTLNYFQTIGDQLIAPLATKAYVDSQDSLKASIIDMNQKADQTDVDAALSLKADKSYVDSQDSTKASLTQLELKADQTYVDSQLSGKANTVDVNNALGGKASVESVNLKADQTYVDTQLQSKANVTDVNNLSNSKVDKSNVNIGLLAYTRNNGVEGTTIASPTNVANSLVMRTNDGTIKSPNPIEGDDLTNMTYLNIVIDNAMSTKADITYVNSRTQPLYEHNLRMASGTGLVTSTCKLIIRNNSPISDSNTLALILYQNGYTSATAVLQISSLYLRSPSSVSDMVNDLNNTIVGIYSIDGSSVSNITRNANSASVNFNTIYDLVREL